MYEENRRFSWTSLFIKIIIVIIFVLFTIWLLSLTTRGLSKSIDVLTNNIFSENIEKMKEVGKSYFTTERLPKKVGEVKKLTLEKMYDNKLLLELKDENGKTCSATESYVSVEKTEDEYQMKVYLDCGKKKDYVITIMGCYNYCNTDICEKQDNMALEYEYQKTTGGYWTNWTNWSNWVKTSITKTNSRDVETKIVKEDNTYDKKVTETKLMGDATCSTLAGYSLVSNTNGVCTYEAYNYDYKNPVCPTVSGYTLTNRNNFTCTYVPNNWNNLPLKADPVCPSGGKMPLVGRNGFTCNYYLDTEATLDPTCPTVDGYTFVSRNGLTCNYTKQVTNTTATETYYGTASGYYVPADNDNYTYKITSADYIYKCDGSCAFRWYYTYTIYAKSYGTTTANITKEAECPTNYQKENNTCKFHGYVSATKTATCPDGYTKSGTTCIKADADITKTATCPVGYTKSGNTCYKYLGTDKTTKSAICPDKQTMKDGKCYSEVTTTVKVTDTIDVTYYRSRTRSFVGAVTDYKWSTSNNDQELINAGYKLTGKTREVGGKTNEK